MITIPEDPVQVWKTRLHSLALTLMDEDPIISVGMRTQPNEIEALGICYEWLPGEAAIRRRVAQYRSSLRNGQRMMALYLLSNMKRLIRAIRSASNR